LDDKNRSRMGILKIRRGCEINLNTSKCAHSMEKIGLINHRQQLDLVQVAKQFGYDLTAGQQASFNDELPLGIREMKTRGENLDSTLKRFSFARQDAFLHQDKAESKRKDRNDCIVPQKRSALLIHASIIAQVDQRAEKKASDEAELVARRQARATRAAEIVVEKAEAEKKRKVKAVAKANKDALEAAKLVGK